MSKTSITDRPLLLLEVVAWQPLMLNVFLPQKDIDFVRNLV
jgi:hypothetical protein